uniref:nucleoside-diphosphate kinase n=1 Tax=Arion vulgaris TaxID=1028688 RepID=A0A0B6Z4Z4_9EUPU
MDDPIFERTFIAVKPDGVHRSFVSDIIKRFEIRGYKLVAAKLLWASKELLCNHYKDVSDRPYYGSLVEGMSSGPIFAMVWEGKSAVKIGRKMLGVTDPSDCEPGTIRGDFCIDIKRTVCHGSDSVEAAKREISLWFSKEEIIQYQLANQNWIFE